MQEYTYSALLHNGKKSKGTYKANSVKEVTAYLKESGLIPVEVKEKAQTENISIRNPFKKTRFKLKDIVFFTRQFATMLNAGLNVSSAIATLKRQPISQSLKTALDNMYSDTTLGISLTESVKKNRNSFPSFLIQMIEVGELSGNLDAIMLKMADYYEREYDVNRKIKGALTYPIVILTVTFFILIFILTFVLPNFISMFEANGAALPLITQVFIILSDSLINNWYIYLGSLIATVFLLRSFLSTKSGHDFMSRLKIRLPIVKKNYQMILTSRFARTMQILLYSGITITYALEITSNVMENTIIKEKVLLVKEDVNSGNPFNTSLQKIKYFPDILISMVEIGETSGSLDDMLEKASSHYDKEMERAVDQLIKLIEPMAILLVAVVVGFAIFAILMPMLDMINLY